MDCKKAAIIGICITILLATVVVSVVYFVKTPGKGENPRNSEPNDDDASNHVNTFQVNISLKANYQKTSVTGQKGAIELALKKIDEAVKTSGFLQTIAKDPKTVEAFNTCEKLLDDSRNDMQRTYDELDSFSLADRDRFIDDLKTWLTGAQTYQQACLHALESTKGDDTEKMKQLVKGISELARNSLDLVDEMSKKISSPGFPRLNRKLLSEPKGYKSRVLDTPSCNVRLRPNVVVAKDGSGKYTTIREALQEIPLKSNQTFVIYVKEGVYKEHVTIEKHMWHVMLIGDGPTKTRITGSQSHGGVLGTYLIATAVVEGDHFIARDIGFENTAGPEMHQAVALRVTADESIFYNCKTDGYENTVYAHNHRQFYRNCTISGTNDIIFGNARVILQNCKLIIKKPMGNQNLCTVTAQGRFEANQNSAIVLQNCQITPAPDYVTLDKSYRVYLGRPWRKFSRTIILDTKLDEVVSSNANYARDLDSSWFVEFSNKVHGANQSKRERWQGIREISEQKAMEFVPGKYFSGDYWIKPSGIPYTSGRMS